MTNELFIGILLGVNIGMVLACLIFIAGGFRALRKATNQQKGNSK